MIRIKRDKRRIRETLSRNAVQVTPSGLVKRSISDRGLTACQLNTINPSNRSAVAALQRTIGNRATEKMLGLKMGISQSSTISDATVFSVTGSMGAKKSSIDKKEGFESLSDP